MSSGKEFPFQSGSKLLRRFFWRRLYRKGVANHAYLTHSMDASFPGGAWRGSGSAPQAYALDLRRLTYPYRGCFRPDPSRQTDTERRQRETTKRDDKDRKKEAQGGGGRGVTLTLLKIMATSEELMDLLDESSILRSKEF